MSSQWCDPTIVPKAYHSSPMETVTVIVCAPSLYPRPVIGFYFPAINEWRIQGSPSKQNNTVIGWLPLPEMCSDR